MLDPKLFGDKSRLRSYSAKVWRMVETQETAATLNIVDSMEEQALLEELLDEIKPPYRKGTEGMHYLFKTAFRYPPLKYGSRFGTRLMPSFFYASEELETVLAETAYYRFVFMADMQQAYAHEIDSWHCAFSVSVRSARCVDLTQKKYTPIYQQLIDPVDYAYCQRVGEWAVNTMHADLIRSISARARNASKSAVLEYQANNIAIADPSAIRSKSPITQQSWLCRTTANNISFSSREAGALQSFRLNDFLKNGKLPRPA